MFCLRGHGHSTREVKVAEFNETEPYGIRPYHCPDCWQTNRVDTIQPNWTLMPITKAINEGRLACKNCFPTVTELHSMPKQ
jgi:hypothetical protein